MIETTGFRDRGNAYGVTVAGRVVREPARDRDE